MPDSAPILLSEDRSRSTRDQSAGRPCSRSAPYAARAWACGTGSAINGWTAWSWSCERGLGWRLPATGAGQCEASNLSAARLRHGARSFEPGLSTAWNAPA